MSKQPKTPLKRSNKEYEDMGRAVDALLQSEFIERKQAYKTFFLKGILSGAGWVIGATILIALLLWFLSIFNNIPLLGPVVEQVRHTVETDRPSKSN